jgi:hypothetical protein
MMMMGYVGGRKIQGDRVVGLTDDGHNPIGIDPSSLAPGGANQRITPAVVHRELRKLAGVTDEVSAQFPITDSVEMPNLITLG